MGFLADSSVKLTRKDFLFGLGGAVAGAPAGALSYRRIHGYRNRYRDQGTRSYAQSGEDLVAEFILRYLKIYAESVNYLDIGANDPVFSNNTYFFYLKGARGVLVEPNVALCARLRAVRPEDR